MIDFLNELLFQVALLLVVSQATLEPAGMSAEDWLIEKSQKLSVQLKDLLFGPVRCILRLGAGEFTPQNKKGLLVRSPFSLNESKFYRSIAANALVKVFRC